MLYTSQTLPLSKLPLDDWQLVKVAGIDNVKFLQGQFTADITKLTDAQFLFSTQCDPKGKVWGNMMLFKRGDDIYYLERKSVVDVQLKELNKYAVFSKVSIELDKTLQCYGIAGKNTAGKLSQHLEALFTDKKNCITINQITYLKIDFPTTRYIVIGEPKDLDQLDVLTQATLGSSEQWMLLDLEANAPIIDLPTSNQYLPQAFNLQNFAAISFDKGCYCGQEMVARAQYRGINKRSLYLLIGNSEILPIVGDTLEQQLDGNWRETGCITATLRLNEQAIWVQAILNNDLDNNALFRVKNTPESHLHIK